MQGVEALLPEVQMARYQNRIELLQGTLDLLILQTLQWGPRHGYGISQAIRASSGESCKSTPDRCIPRCTASSAKNGLRPTGNSPTTNSAFESTG
jgi:hypothetical protein